MGRASREKRERREKARLLPSLVTRLQEQHQLLMDLGAMFDEGRPHLALPLATSIRVLVHDTGASTSVLKQLGIKDDLRFKDTALHINPRNLAPTPGLVVTKMTTGHGAEWEAPLDWLPPPRMHPDLGFGQWWKMHLSKDMSGNTWSRQDFVLYLVNKEGGAHVDPYRPDHLRALEEDGTLGRWTYHDPIVGDKPMLNGPLLPSVRQIGYELQTSLFPVLGSEAHPT